MKLNLNYALDALNASYSVVQAYQEEIKELKKQLKQAERERDEAVAARTFAEEVLAGQTEHNIRMARALRILCCRLRRLQRRRGTWRRRQR